jgi:hypothetical protein
MAKGTTLSAIVNDPDHARLLCEVLSEQSGFPVRTSYQVLRQQKPEQLLMLYNMFCIEGPQRYREEFALVYHNTRGDSIGPLFAPHGM